MRQDGVWHVDDFGRRDEAVQPEAEQWKEEAKSGAIENAGLLVYANNAAAWAAGLQAGQMYRMASGDLKIVY
jgi:hypothetical protein